MIHNYLGFPWGISGRDLTERARRQATRFGAQFVVTQAATGLRSRGNNRVVTLSNGSEVVSRAVVIATGVSYRRLEAPGIEPLVGAGIFYGPPITEAQAFQGEQVYLIGAGNSAGAAAVHLASYAARVTILVRGTSLTQSMSDYLIREIEARPNVEVRFSTQVAGAQGHHQLERLVLADAVSGATETVSAAALFILIGAEPHTGWLTDVLARDSWGYILTGRDLSPDGHQPASWSLDRPPFLLETSMPGVLAAGDVRHRSMKRVASAVGEGAIAIRIVHDYLGEQ
jgi:thioredoxin reductase (NADPH)